jgi:hypothetical protein
MSDPFAQIYKPLAPGELEALLATPSPNVHVFDSRHQPEVRADGLIEHMRRDRTGREFFEFELANGRDERTGWMRPYMPETVGVQVRLNTQPKADPVADAIAAERAEAQWHEFQATAARVNGGRS